jgi:predicted extracellular nuclease
MRIAVSLFCFLLFMPASFVTADEAMVIATWNVGLLDRSVSDLNLDGFAAEIDADILVFNEIKTIADIQGIQAVLDREEDFTAISSFETGSGNLEVGLISRFPITEVVEFDRSPETNQVSPQQRRLERVNLPGIADVGVGRGFLVAHIPSQNVVVIVTHLKSSRGQTGSGDRANAQKRELVAAAIADHVNDLIEEFPLATLFVLGDFNVGGDGCQQERDRSQLRRHIG